MGSAMLVAIVWAGANAAAAGGDVHAVRHPPPVVTALPMAGGAAWPTHRCGDGVPGTDEANAGAAIDAACVRLTVDDRTPYRAGAGRRPVGGGGGDAGGSWRIVRAVLPGLEGLEGLVGPGGFGLGIGSELQLVRGAHMTLHLAAAHDTRIAATTFAPETTVLARCGACWTESEAAGAGLLAGTSGGRRAASSALAR